MATISTPKMISADERERFLRLLLPLRGSLVRFAEAMTGDAERARDLVGDTVLAALEGFSSVRDERAFLSYLFTVASRIHQRSRRRGRWVDFGGEHPEPEHRGTSPELSADVRMLYDALEKLPPAQREAVVLFELSDLTLEDIRHIQGGTLSGVKSRLRRGRAELARLLGATEQVATGSPSGRPENGNPAGENDQQEYHIYTERGRHALN